MLEQSFIANQVTERRSKPRIDCSYPAIVQGWDADGRKFRSNAILTNISATGICLKLQSDFQPGKDLFVIFSCSSTGPLGQSKAPLIAVNGDIVRSDRPTPGMHTVALKILRNRFL